MGKIECERGSGVKPRGIVKKKLSEIPSEEKAGEKLRGCKE